MSTSGFDSIKSGTVGAASLSLAVATIGAGILALPSAFADAGVVTSVAVMVLVAAFTVVSIRYLSVCIETLNLHSYESISRELLGPTFEMVMRVMLILYNFGVGVGYVVAVGELLEPFQPWISATFPLLSSKTLIMVVFWLFVMLPLTCVRRLTALNRLSLLAVIAIHYIAFAVVYRYFVPFDSSSHKAQLLSNMHNSTTASSSHRAPRYGRHVERQPHQLGVVATIPTLTGEPLQIHLASWDTIAVLAMPIMFFAFDCQALTFQIYHSLTFPSVSAMSSVATNSVTMCFIVYALTGAFGYLSNGQFVRDNILNNYDPNADPVFALAYALYAIPVNLAFALVLFPVRDAIFNYIHHTAGGDEEDEHVSDKQHHQLSIVLSTLCLVCALFTPGLVSIFSLLGAVCGSTICFIYPALFRIRLHQLAAVKARSNHSLRVMWGMLGFGAFGATFGTAVALWKMFFDT